MAVSQKLELRHSQSLVMTPQLQQAIKLLQLSNLELSAYVEQELEQNPFLERDAAADAAAEPGAATASRGDEDDMDDRRGEDVWDGAPPEFSEAPVPRTGAGEGADDLSGLEQRLAQETSLRGHLLQQAAGIVAGPVERAIAEALIDSLDEAGYLATSPEELGVLLGVPAEDVEATRQKLCGCDPAGVFALGLSECLAIQLRERNRLDPAMQALLDNLDLLGRHDFAQLRRLCAVSAEDFSDMVAELRALDPKPALAFAHAPVQPVVPDILMRSLPNGGYAVELNAETLPRVLVNNRYYAEVAPSAQSKTDKSYLADRLQSANWITRALEQRATTILKVAREIVRRQQCFFTKGISHLRPLTLREVASAVEMHESTISRVTANKYIATPRGIFELKYFFTASIGGADGESHSAEAVRHRIKGLIDKEVPDKVLSDDRIVEILRAEGIDIARRTVAKYREAMGIASSVQRRRAKALQA